MKISERIKKFRKDNNLTQSEFAEMLFVTKQAVSKWENDRGVPDVSLYPELAKVLNVTVDELMGLDVNKNNLKKNNNVLIILLTSLVVLISVLVLFLTKDLYIQKKYENRVEEIISVDLPNINQFNYYDLTNITVINNIYPLTIYHFIFEENYKINDFEEYLLNDEKWLTELQEVDKNKLPYYLIPYNETCDYFYLIENEQGNIFMGYQKELNRLIVSEYKEDLK